jgi:hypothetical protein
MKRSTLILACLSALAFSAVCSRLTGCALLRQEGEASYAPAGSVGWHAPELTPFPANAVLPGPLNP